MTQLTSPFVDVKYGWNYGESGWNSGMDENLLKFSFLFDGNIDSIVSSLPAPTSGTAYFNTSDMKIYFSVNNTWYFTTPPKWFILKIKSSGATYQFNGTSLTLTPSTVDLQSRVVTLETVAAGLGTASTKAAEYFSTPSQVTSSINTFKSQLASSTGATLIGKGGSTVDVVLDNKASKGINSDITQLTGLTTPLSVAQGGNGGVDVISLAAAVTSLQTTVNTKLSVTSTGGDNVSGWKKLSDGTIEQWGVVSVSNAISGVTFSFNTPFLTAVRFFQAANTSSTRAATGEANSGYSAVSLTQFKIASGLAATPVNYNWHAIGV